MSRKRLFSALLWQSISKTVNALTFLSATKKIGNSSLDPYLHKLLHIDKKEISISLSKCI